MNIMVPVSSADKIGKLLLIRGYIRRDRQIILCV